MCGGYRVHLFPSMSVAEHALSGKAWRKAFICFHFKTQCHSRGLQLLLIYISYIYLKLSASSHQTSCLPHQRQSQGRVHSKVAGSDPTPPYRVPGDPTPLTGYPETLKPLTGYPDSRTD